jgi:hypothetical protein
MKQAGTCSKYRQQKVLPKTDVTYSTLLYLPVLEESHNYSKDKEINNFIEHKSPLPVYKQPANQWAVSRAT